MRHSKPKQIVATTLGALALLALAAPAADAGKSKSPTAPAPASTSVLLPADVILPPVSASEPMEPTPCICPPPAD